MLSYYYINIGGSGYIDYVNVETYFRRRFIFFITCTLHHEKEGIVVTPNFSFSFLSIGSSAYIDYVNVETYFKKRFLHFIICFTMKKKVF